MGSTSTRSNETGLRKEQFLCAFVSQKVKNDLGNELPHEAELVVAIVDAFLW